MNGVYEECSLSSVQRDLVTGVEQKKKKKVVMDSQFMPSL